MLYNIRVLAIGVLVVLRASHGVDGNDVSSLLQVPSVDVEAATEVSLGDSLSGLLAKPESVFEDMTSKVSALEEQMALMKKQADASLANQAKVFRKTLDQQAANNTLLETSNTGLKEEIEALKTSNNDKRQQAKTLTATNKDLTSNLQHARELIVTAHEFVEMSLKKHADVGEADLQILTELDDQDSASLSQREHEARLSEVSKRLEDMMKIGMLQVSATTEEAPRAPAAAGLVQGLGSGLSEFAARSQEGESQLKAHFIKNYKMGADRKAALLEEQKSLQSQRASLQQLGSRLDVAIAHLEKTKTGLEENLRSLQGFAVQDLGNLSKGEQKKADQ